MTRVLTIVLPCPSLETPPAMRGCERTLDRGVSLCRLSSRLTGGKAMCAGVRPRRRKSIDRPEEVTEERSVRGGRSGTFEQPLQPFDPMSMGCGDRVKVLLQLLRLTDAHETS